MSKLIFTVESYNYFRRNNAHQFEKKVFDNIVEGFKAYKESLSKDYNYGDAFQYTRDIKLISPEITPERINRWHARSKEEWEEIEEYNERCEYYRSSSLEFSEEELDHILSLDDDIII